MTHTGLVLSIHQKSYGQPNDFEVSLIYEIEYEPLQAVDKHPSMPQVAVADESTIKVYNLTDLSYSSILINNLSHPPYELKWSPDASFIAIASENHSNNEFYLDIWDTTTGEKISQLIVPEGVKPIEIQWSHDSQYLLSLQGYIWTIEEHQQPLNIIENTGISFRGLSWSSDENLIAILSGSQLISMAIPSFEIQFQQEINVSSRWVQVIWNSRGIAVFDNNKLKIFDHSGLQTLSASIDDISRTWSVDWADDGRLLSSSQISSGQSRVVIWDISDDTITTEITTIPTTQSSLIMGTGEAVLLADPLTRGNFSYLPSGTVKLWHLSPSRQLRQIERFRGAIRHANVSLDGIRIAISSSDNLTRISDLASSRVTLVASGGNAKWSPQGQILSTQGDSNLYVWDVETETQLFQVEIDSIILNTEWSPDGNRIAIMTLDRTISIIDSFNGAIIHSFDITDPLPPSVPQSFAWSADGTQLAVISSNHSVNIWDMQGNIVGQIQQNTGEGLGFSPDIKWSPQSDYLAYSGFIGGEWVPIVIFDFKTQTATETELSATVITDTFDWVCGDYLISPHNNSLLSARNSEITNFAVFDTILGSGLSVSQQAQRLVVYSLLKAHIFEYTCP